MNKTSLLIIFFLVLSSLFLQAQTLKNSFGMALNRVHLNQINATGTSYSFQYSRYSQKKINSIQAKIGYLSIRNFATDNSGLLPEYNPKNGPCFTGDISFFHNFIKQKAHKLRLGIGPSVWYINDVYKPPIIKNSKFLNIIHVVSIVEEKIEGMDFGYNSELSYEYTSHSRFLIGSRLSYINTIKLKKSFWVALNISYQF